MIQEQVIKGKIFMKKRLKLILVLILLK